MCTSRFLLIGNIGLIQRSTAVATASWSTFEGIVRVLCCYCMASSSCHSSCSVPHYPRSTFKGTPTYTVAAAYPTTLRVFKPAAYPTTLRVPPKVLQPAVATAILRNMRPRYLVRRKLDVYYNRFKDYSSTFNPNLPNPVNLVPFGKMTYSLFDLNLINIYDHNLHICIFVFLFVSE